MKAIIDLSQYKNKSELLGALVGKLGLNLKKTIDLDSLYESLIVGSEDLYIVFIHKAQLSKSLSVYFGMLTMTIEEAAETRRNLKTSTYYQEEEEQDANGTQQKSL